MEQIDVVLYINLDHRTDRREHIEKEIKLLAVDPSKIVRIAATYHPVGVIGCVKSHIQALDLFMSNSSWKTCMVIEDDFTFKSRTHEDIQHTLRYFLNNIDTWDVLTLAFNPSEFKTLPTSNEGIVKVLGTQTTSGYLLNKSFAPTLLANFKEGCVLKEHNPRLSEYCLDIYWKQLQPAANWYALVPAVGYQCEGYSDIEKKVVNYGC